MRMKLNFRIVIFTLAVIFGLAFSAPSLLQLDKGAKITLGLDLQGGLHMLLGVKTEEAIISKLKSVASSVKHFSNREKILLDELNAGDKEVTFVVLDSDDMPSIDAMLKDIEDGASDDIGPAPTPPAAPAAPAVEDPAAPAAEKAPVESTDE